MMKGSVQRSSRAAAVSSLWNSSYSQSYQSTAAIFPEDPDNDSSVHPGSNNSSSGGSRNNTLRSLKKSTASNDKSAGSSIRNSAFSKARVRCLDPCGCCDACYDSKLVVVEPLVFMIMFAVYLHKIAFEMYSFNHNARMQLEGRPLDQKVCYLTTILSNSSALEDYGYYNDKDGRDLGDLVEDKTGKLFMTVGITSGLLSIIGTFCLGPFSNFFGRKGALALLTTGLFLQAVFTTIIVECELSLYFFVLAAAFRALTGNVSGMYIIAFSFITEACKNLQKKWHSPRIGLVETISFIAVTLGFVLGGLAIYYQQCDFKILVYLILAITLAAFLYCLLVAPEVGDEMFASSTSKKNPAPIHAPLVFTDPKTVLQGAMLMVRKRSPHVTMWLSLVVMVVTIMNFTGVTSIISLYLLNKPLSWYPHVIGAVLGAAEFVRGLVLVIVLPWLLSTGVHDVTIVTLSMILTIAMNVALGFVTKPWQLVLVGIFHSGEVLVVPTLKAIMSKCVEPEEKTALFSFLSVVHLVSSVLGYAVYMPVYIHNWNYSHGRSTPFFVMAVLYLLVLPLLCTLGIMKDIKRRRMKQMSLLTNVSDDDMSTNTDGEEHARDPPVSSVGLASSLLLNKSNIKEGNIRNGHQQSSGLPKSQRSSLDASVGLDVAKETFGEDSWMLHSYSSMSEYHASR